MRAVVTRTLIAVAAITLGARGATAQEGGIAIGTVAPAARVVTLDGKTVDLADYYGAKPVVLEFWATWTGKFVFDADDAAIMAFSVPHTSYIVVIDAARRVVYTGVGGDQDIEAALKKAGL